MNTTNAGDQPADFVKGENGSGRYPKSKFVYVRVHNRTGVEMLLEYYTVRHGILISAPQKFISPHGSDKKQQYREQGSSYADAILYYAMQDTGNSLVTLEFNWQGSIKGSASNAPGLKISWTTYRDRPYGADDLYIDYYIDELK